MSEYQKAKSTPLTEFLNSINQSKRNIIKDDADPVAKAKAYPAFIVRRLLSYHKDCLQVCQILNLLPDLDNDMQYEFLLHMLPKGKRYSKLIKPETSEHLQLVKKYYGYNDERALEVLCLHTEDDFLMMSTYMNEGGILH